MTNTTRGDHEFVWRSHRRQFLRGMGSVAALAAGASWIVDACGNGSSRTPQPAKGGHLVEGAIADVSYLNSVLYADTQSNLVVSLLFDGLLGSRPNGDLFPLLAASMPTISADQTTYTFRLRRDVRWSDGHPLTADDVVFTYRLMYAPEYQAVNSPRRADLARYLRSVTAPDPYTVVFETRGVWAPFLALHAQREIMPAHILGGLSAAAINTASFNTAPPVASGPFKFVRWDKGQQIVLARNEMYYRGAPHLDQYVYRVVPDSATLAQQLKTGEVDFAPVDPALWDSLRKVENVARVPPFGVPSFIFYAYQLDPAKPASKFFGDKRVRQALLYALDRQSMADRVYFQQATVADSVEPPTSWAHVAATPSYRFDKRKAESLLDAAGWVRGPDGIRARDGAPLAFEMVTGQSSKVGVNLLQIMQQAWADIGVQATPRLVQSTQLVANITNQRSFDMFLFGFNFHQDPDESTLWSSAAAAPGGSNGFQFKDPRADQLMNEAVATLDETKRKQVYARFQDLMNDEVPAPILLFNRGLWAVSGRVRGIDSGTFGGYNQYSSRQFMKDVFVTSGG